ncbi:MAG: WbqC family protein [Bacteroidia bacterium]|nr:WbqC family protein [Bacteroidia bacterium]
MKQETILMSLPYLPCIAWVQHALTAEYILLEAQEHYTKQTYRNRTRILAANGALNLNIPILHQTGKQIITQVETDANENWKHNHWQSIVSAYGNAAYFIYYRHYFETFFLGSNRVNLWEHNLGLLQVIFKILKQPFRFEPTKNYEKGNNPLNDFRAAFNSKNSNPETELLFNKNYLQVFTGKFHFEPNLSILDLIFNTGPDAERYLVRIG